MSQLKPASLDVINRSYYRHASSSASQQLQPKLNLEVVLASTLTTHTTAPASTHSRSTTHATATHATTTAHAWRTTHATLLPTLQ